MIPQGDNRERDVCLSCGAIHYQNPRIIAGSLPVSEGKILLCKRAIEPRLGYWTLPAGFMENGETTSEAARRETLEEATAHVQIENLYTVFNLPHINQVYMIFMARLIEAQFAPGEESLEVALFDEADIPWDELAFPTIARTLRHYYADRASGHFPLHVEDIVWEHKRRPT
jgi:ADP-ribose pyrophosphatase YjhB (NUDIX family)